jgi:hypothetical protein
MEVWGGGRPFASLRAFVRVRGRWRCGADRRRGHGMAGKEMALILAPLRLGQEQLCFGDSSGACRISVSWTVFVFALALGHRHINFTPPPILPATPPLAARSRQSRAVSLNSLHHPTEAIAKLCDYIGYSTMERPQ